MKSVEYKPGELMKKNYTYILCILSMIFFFFILQKTSEINDSWTRSYLAKLEQERFFRSRISKAREEEIRKIVKNKDQRRLISLLENTMKNELVEAGRESVAHVNDLKETYPDIRGRIIIPGTEIDFPIVQSEDNDFYLDHDYDGSYYINGGVFIDHLHNGDFCDQNTVIYGHNVRIGFIFHDLDKFRDKNFVKNHSEIIIDTPKERRTFEVVCAMDVDVDADYRYNYYYDEYFDDYLNLIKENNIIEGKPLPKIDDKLITLSTCSDLNDRFAIVAVETTNKFSENKAYAKRKNKLLNDRRMTREISIY